MNKRNTDYCGAYELMKHDKLKKECFKLDGPNGHKYHRDSMDYQSTGDSKKTGTLRSI